MSEVWKWSPQMIINRGGDLLLPGDGKDKMNSIDTDRTPEGDAHWFPFWYCRTCRHYTANPEMNHIGHAVEKITKCPTCGAAEAEA